MAIGVAEENLPRAVGPHLPRTEISFHLREVRFPFVETVRAQGKMIAAIVRVHRFRALANDVQLLRRAEPKPRARKSERRTWHAFELQHLAVKITAHLHVAHVNSNVI